MAIFKCSVFLTYISEVWQFLKVSFSLLTFQKSGKFKSSVDVDNFFGDDQKRTKSGAIVSFQSKKSLQLLPLKLKIANPVVYKAKTNYRKDAAQNIK
jgi:hypothetical protein